MFVKYGPLPIDTKFPYQFDVYQKFRRQSLRWALFLVLLSAYNCRGSSVTIMAPMTACYIVFYMY